MKVNVISIAKDRLLIYHDDDDGKFLKDLQKILENYGVYVENVSSTRCG